MKNHGRTLVRLALRSAGLDVWSTISDYASTEGPELLSVDEVPNVQPGLLKISPLWPTGVFPSSVYLPADKFCIVVDAWRIVTGIEDRFATEAEAQELWVIVARAAGRAAHAGGRGCVCPGCSYERNRRELRECNEHRAMTDDAAARLLGKDGRDDR